MNVKLQISRKNSEIVDELCTFVRVFNVNLVMFIIKAQKIKFSVLQKTI